MLHNMESKEKFFIRYSIVTLQSIDFIENRVQRRVLDFLLKSTAIVYICYTKFSPKKSARFSSQK